jgi:hypothetical protein
MSETTAAVKEAPLMWSRDWEDLDSVFYVEAERLTLEQAQAALTKSLDPDYLESEGLAVVPDRQEVFLLRNAIDCDCDEYPDAPPCPDPDCRHKHDVWVYVLVCEEVTPDA